MTDFDRYFKKSGQATVHPKVRYWKQRADEGLHLTCELLREREGLTFGPAKLYVHFLNTKGQELLPPDETDWVPSLNNDLIAMGVKALNVSNEAERFGLMLQDLLEAGEKFGDGFYNSVLSSFIKKSPFAKISPISEQLSFIREYEPYKEQAFYDCNEIIEEAIGRCASALVSQLRYFQPGAINILAHAIGYYLDERFSITNRKMLGFARRSFAPS